METQEKLTFQQELERLINKHSKENESSTPDFILAKYLDGCLHSYNEALKARDSWFGFTPFKNETSI